ncbi:MAG: hypothetical protein SOI38_03770 [Eggerthellaceae bacterium]|jgi:hypothetical protein
MADGIAVDDRWSARAKDALPDVRFGVSVNVAEQRAGAWTLREVALDPASGE